MADSSDDEKQWAKDVKKQYRLIKESKKQAELEEEKNKETEDENVVRKQPKFYELKEGYNKPRYMRQQAKYVNCYVDNLLIN